MTIDCIPTKVPVRNVRRKILFYLLIFLILAAIIVLFLWHFYPPGFWDGRFRLNLDVQSLSGKRIDKVLYATFSTQDVADLVATDRSDSLETGLHPAVNKSNGFEAEIPCYGKIGPFNIEYGYGEESYIVVDVTDEKGNNFRKTFHIPPGRGQRTLQVLIP